MKLGQVWESNGTIWVLLETPESELTWCDIEYASIGKRLSDAPIEEYDNLLANSLEEYFKLKFEGKL